MTVTAEDNKWGPYPGNGATVAFNAGKVFDQDDLIVYVIEDATGNADLQVITTDYTVAGVLTNDVVVTLNSAPAAGFSVLIYRSIPKTQTSDFKNAGSFLPKAHEDRMDRITMMIQDLEEKFSRALKIDILNIAGDISDIPQYEDGKFLGAVGNDLQWLAISETVIPNASETEHGLIEIATTAEAQTGTDQERAMTPYLLQQVTATETRKGVLELATDAEVTTGTDTARAVTPAGLQQKVATSTAKGIVELATDAELQTGTDTDRAVTCANITALKASQATMETGTSTTFLVTPGRQVHHPCASKLWLKAGVSADILASFNITSLTDDGAGLVTVTIATDFSGVDFSLVATVERTATSLAVSSLKFVNIRTATLAAGSFTLECYDGTATTAVQEDPSSWHCVGFGDR